MKVYLLKNVPQVGIAGEILKVSDGFGMNYLIPRNLAVKVTEENESFYQNKVKVVENRKEAVATETSMLAERIKGLTLTIKHKIHDDDRLYASIAPSEIVDLLNEQGIKISKSQVELDKSIKKKGTYDVTIKLSSRLKPVFKLKVVGE
jgi:large subunit ribosomal protein L9